MDSTSISRAKDSSRDQQLKTLFKRGLQKAKVKSQPESQSQSQSQESTLGKSQHGIKNMQIKLGGSSKSRLLKIKWYKFTLVLLK
jgi:hypothetical protein